MYKRDVCEWCFAVGEKGDEWASGCDLVAVLVIKSVTGMLKK